MPELTPGQIAYGAWHGKTPAHVAAEEWPADDRIVKRWEAVGAAVAQAVASRERKRAAAIATAAVMTEPRLDEDAPEVDVALKAVGIVISTAIEGHEFALNEAGRAMLRLLLEGRAP